MGDDLVAGAELCLREREIGAPDQHFRIACARLRRRRPAGGNADGGDVPVEIERLGQQGEDRSESAVGARRAEAGDQHDGEIVRPHARDSGKAGLVQAIDHLSQHLVAGQMPQSAVYGFEAPQVEDGDMNAPRLAPLPQGGSEQGNEAAARKRAGQFVMIGKILQPLGTRAERRDVSEGQADDDVFAAIAPAGGGARCRHHIGKLEGAGRQIDLELGGRIGALGVVARQRAVDCRNEASGQHLVDAAPDEIAAQPFGCDPACLEDDAVRIDDDHAGEIVLDDLVEDVAHAVAMGAARVHEPRQQRLHGGKQCPHVRHIPVRHRAARRARMSAILHT